MSISSKILSVLLVAKEQAIALLVEVEVKDRKVMIYPTLTLGS